MKPNRNKGRPSNSGSGIVKSHPLFLDPGKGKVGVSKKTFLDLILPARSDLVEVPDETTDGPHSSKPETMREVGQPKMIGRVVESCRQTASRRINFPPRSKLPESGVIHPSRRRVAVEEEILPEEEMVLVQLDSRHVIDLRNEGGQAIMIPGDEMQGDLGKVILQVFQPIKGLRDRNRVRKIRPPKVEDVSIQHEHIHFPQVS